MRLAVASLALGLMSACTVAEQLAQQTIRQEAKAVVNGLVAERLPGVNAAPITDCVIDNATTAEIVTIGQAAVTGVTPEVTELVFSVFQRPGTIGCISDKRLQVMGVL